MRIEEPLHTNYKGIEVYKLPIWQQGPVLLQSLNILENTDVRAMGYNTPKYMHTIYQTMNLAFADREAWYGDPEFYDVPVATLLSRAYADERHALVGDEAASELRPGVPVDRLPELGHYPQLEDPAAIVAALHGALERATV